MEKVFEIYIRTTPERLWEAITSSDIRSKYQFGSRITSDWTSAGLASRWRIRTRTACSARESTSRSTRRAGWCRA